MMVVLFVHGLGRSPRSGWPLLRRLRQGGLKTETFGYIAAIEGFEAIVGRLRRRLEGLAQVGPYLVVGHSLGGVLLRAAINSLPQGVVPPEQVYLLGSPLRPPRLATRLKDNPVFRLLAGDCGQVLGSAERMGQVGPLHLPTTAIVGVRGLTGPLSPFGQEVNDSLVSLSEVSAEWLLDQVPVPIVHTLLPSSVVIADIILDRLAAQGGLGE